MNLDHHPLVHREITLTVFQPRHVDAEFPSTWMLRRGLYRFFRLGGTRVARSRNGRVLGLTKTFASF